MQLQDQRESRFLGWRLAKSRSNSYTQFLMQKPDTSEGKTLRQLNPEENIAYGGSVVAFLAAMTLNELAALIGILTAILTGVFSVWHNWRRDMREEALRREQAEQHRLIVERLRDRTA